MKKIRKSVLLVLMVAGVVFINGCSNTSSSPKNIALEEEKAAQIRADAEKERREKQQVQMEDSLKQIPNWVLIVPKPDDTGIYAVGTAEADKVQVALKMASLEAEYGLAKNYNQELSGSERSYLQNNAGRTTSEQYTELIDKLVSQVNVSGFEVVKQEVRPIDGKYNAFILMKLPYEEFNAVLKDQRAKAKPNDKVIAEAFDDLGRRLEARRKQRLEDEKAAQSTDVGTGKDAQPVASAQTVVTNPQVSQVLK